MFGIVTQWTSSDRDSSRCAIESDGNNYHSLFCHSHTNGCTSKTTGGADRTPPKSSLSRHPLLCLTPCHSHIILISDVLLLIYLQVSELADMVFHGTSSKALSNSSTLDCCTCCVVKPHAVKARTTGKILDMIIEAGYEVSAMVTMTMDKAQAEEFLEVYKQVIFLVIATYTFTPFHPLYESFTMHTAIILLFPLVISVSFSTVYSFHLGYWLLSLTHP